MKSRFLALSLLLVTALGAQTAIPFPLPYATAGVPYSLNLGEGFDQIQTVEGFDFSFLFTATNPPPGLTMKPNGLFSGTPTAPGDYSFGIDFKFHIGYMGQSYDLGYTLNATLHVNGTAADQQVTVDPKGLTFSYTLGATAGYPQSITINNRTSVPRTTSVAVTTSDGGNWLSASGGGSVGPFATGSVMVNVDPSRFVMAGTYKGTVSVTVSPGQTFDVPVIATLNGSQLSLTLSQTGLRFLAVESGGAPATQSIAVLAGGKGTVNYTVSTSTLAGGTSWLSVSPGSGKSDATTTGSVTVNVDSTRLKAGDYYGQIQFAAADAANSPQIATVVLNVLPSTAKPGATLQTTGLIFVAAAGGGNPAPKSIVVSNPSPTDVTFGTASFFENGSNWFTVQGGSNSAGGGQTATVTIQPVIAGLTPGVYKGEIELQFADGSVRRAAVLLIVIPGGSTVPGTGLQSTEQAACQPTKLLPVFTQLGAGFKTTAAWPTPIEVTVVDDCGTPMVAGSVGASFSSGDPALALLSLKDGRWSATWQPRNSSSTQVTVTVKAQQVLPALQGSEMIGGNLAPNLVTPLIAPGGAVSAVNGQAPLAPRSFISIYGQHLSKGLVQAPSLPLGNQLGDTQALLAGRPLPLLFTSDGQVNAVVPTDIPVNTTQQLIVQQGTSISVPEPVTIAAAQPAAFTGAGLFVAVRNGAVFTVSAAQPVQAGDVLVFYASGLGPVDADVPTGNASPSSPLARVVTPIQVTIGGKTANVLFAGLAPTYVALYQVNLVVPDGITPGPEVSMVITALGQQSVPAKLPVQ